MTTFNIDYFSWDGHYLMYCPEGFIDNGNGFRYLSKENIKFVARFKYGSKPWKKWANFLVKNFTQEEYFTLADETSPLEAVESKGWFHPSSLIKREMKAGGFPLNLEGYKAFLSDHVKKIMEKK